jgi:hypothetical protein
MLNGTLAPGNVWPCPPVPMNGSTWAIGSGAFAGAMDGQARTHSEATARILTGGDLRTRVQ